MNRVVLKHQLFPPGDFFVSPRGHKEPLRVARGFRVLSVHSQREQVMVWIEHADYSAGVIHEQKWLEFWLVPTGQVQPEELASWNFLGAVLLSGGDLVLHVYYTSQ